MYAQRIRLAAALCVALTAACLTTIPASAAPSVQRSSGLTYGQASVFGLSRTGKVCLSSQRVLAGTTAQDQAGKAMAALFTLPGRQDPAFGIWTAIPASANIVWVRVTGNTAKVNVTSAFATGTTWRLWQRTAQVVYTLTAIKGITKVSFWINGVHVTRIGSSGPYVGWGATRSTFERVTPAILITSTRPGTHVDSPFTVSGSATTFEAVVHYRLQTLSGKVLQRGTTMANNSYRGAFRLTITTSYHGSVHLVMGGDAPRGDVEMVDPAVTPLYIH